MYFKASFLLAASIFCAAVGASVVQRIDGDPDLEVYLLEALENFREQMRKGIPTIRMPVLDPLVFDHLYVNYVGNSVTLKLKVYEMTVTGLSTFEVNYLSSNLEEFHVNASFSIPQLDLQGDYDLNSTVYKIIPIYGNGKFHVSPSDVIIRMDGQLSFTNDTLQVTTLILDLDWHNMTMELGNFLGGGSLSEVLQRIMPDFGHVMYEGFKSRILQYLDEALTKKINEKFQDPEIKKIIAGILPEKETEYPIIQN